ncbi:LamG-like jellyroll fold domain-containing protein [Kitasatospora sp. NPDC008050]|uniref:LamG-like jellyroll fold domain-containing protein n=1 Tax=Kitasatospora sp. NPDC008050 TaxID=3364021 RepID=UPI0036EFD96D
MTENQHLAKVYSDRAYLHTTTVRHQGSTVAFAMDERRRIVYTVLDLSQHDEARGEADAAYWSENPLPLRFPGELARVGYAVAGAVRLPSVKRGGRIEADAAERLEEDELDPFLSSTARLGAAAPFQVVSDGTHVYVLRQSIRADDADAVFRLADGTGSSGDAARTDYLTRGGGGRAAVVDATLLCDRFVLVGGELKPVLEVRYRRSRHKGRPDSAKDSLGTRDMEGRAFHEPTQELSFVRSLSGGRFTALLVPTAVQGRERWQFFAHNDATGRIDGFSVERSRDGLFNTQGSQAWTSPDERYRDAVYESAPGTCPFTGRPLVPVVSESGHAETALRFDGVDDVAELSGSALQLADSDFTVEFWARRTATGGREDFLVGHGAAAGARLRSLHIGFRSDDTFAFAFYADDLNVAQRTTDTDWHHWACVFVRETRQQIVYRDGVEVGRRTTDMPYAGLGPLTLGRALGSFGRAELDEVRIWNRPRSGAEIAVDRGRRLIGNEPGLAVYYRFDEGSGDTLFDQTDNARNATLRGGPAWITSQAPIGENPGVRRDSFAFTGRRVVSGLSAVLHHQQEAAPAGYDGAAKPVKRQARVLLACATSGPDPVTGKATDDAYLATLDLGVGRDGRLAEIPDQLPLPVLAAPESSGTVDAVGDLDAQVAQLVQDVATTEAEIARLQQETVEIPELERRRAALVAGRDDDVTLWRYRLRFKLPKDGKDQYLAVESDRRDAKAPLVRTTNRTAASTLWTFEPTGTSLNGITCYFLRNVNSGQDMNVYGGKTDNDTPVIQYHREADNDATHFALDNWNGRSLVVRRSGKVVCARDGQGDRIVQYDYWTVNASGEGIVVLERDGASSRQGSGADQRSQQILEIDNQLLTLSTKQEALGRYRRDLPARQAQLAAKREELGRLTGGVRGSDDIALPMPQLAVDRTGLSSSGALLAFARGTDRPFLLDSATGSVVLYFRGANGQFFAGYYDTQVLRSSRQLAAGGKAVAFTARDAGIELATAEIGIETGDNPAQVKLTIRQGGQLEQWSHLPRRAEDFAAVVNGAAEQPVPIGTVLRIDGDTVQFTEGTLAPLAGPGFVTVGGHGFRFEGSHPSSAKSLRLGAGADLTLLKPGMSVQRVRYDQRWATSSEPGVTLSAGSRLVTVDPGGLAEIPVGIADGLLRGHGGRWRADMPGRAYAFDGQGRFLALPAEQLPRVATPGDLTVEAWVNPERVEGPVRLVHANAGDSPYGLGLLGSPAASALAYDGVSAVAAVPGAFGFGEGDFSIEFWARRTAVDDRNHYVLGHSGDQGRDSETLHIGFRSNGKFTFAFYSDDLDTTQRFGDTQWHHWACVFERGTSQQVIYRDGQEIARRTAKAPYRGQGKLSLAQVPCWPREFASVQVDEVRLWSTARGGDDVRAAMKRRLTGAEAGLLGYWVHSAPAPGAQPVLSDRSANKRHAELRGKPGPVAAVSPIEGGRYWAVATVGERRVVSRETFPLREWSHFAAAYQQSWAVRLDAGAYLEVADDDALDIADDLTLEVYARLDRLGETQGLLSKGRTADGAGGSVPYRLAVLPDGRLEFAFEEPEGRAVRFTSTEGVKAGTFHRIAVVRKSGRSMQEQKGTRQITAAGADGKPVTQSVELVESVAVREWQDIRFHLDGREIGTARYEGPGPRGNDAPLELGRAREGSLVQQLTGVLAEVRIWGAARDAAQLGTAVTARDRGLTARWRFEENAGSTAADATGSHPAKLRGARWVRNPDPRGSVFRLYRNGVAIACDPADAPGTPDSAALADPGDAQLTLGAVLKGGKAAESFNGVLEEVRIWRTARTHEQLLDNLFTRLKGEKEDLIAYWPFDRDSTEPDVAQVRDDGLRGNHLRLGPEATRPRTVLSSAPVSTDTAQVRSALAGMRTPFHETIAAAPAVAEYADMQYGARGEAFGVLKRAYSYLRDGRWHLVTGYKVGELVSEWVSQIQFDPQLVGYVEGAPPVPSENLTAGLTDPAGDTFEGASTVQLTEAEQVVRSLSSAKERSVDAAFGFALSNEVDVDVWMITAPLGFGIAKAIAKGGVSASVRGNLEFSNSWAEETSVSQGENTARTTKVSLTGHWEDPGRLLNPATGRRYVPANTGFAVVQSQTADVFALRLAHSGALVAYRIQPNPDIPKDWNVIPFPINPRYTKQGTLDGTVGFDQRGKVADPDYQGARDRGEYSYFKPREAYALKRRIQRDQQRLHSYYDTVSTETHAPDPTAQRAGRVLGGAIGTDAAPAQQRETADSATGQGFSRRDLVNTYVWTAAGGFFAETTETTDVVSETTSGSYSLSGSVATSIGTSFQIAGIGIGAQLDASVGGGMTATRARGKEATRSFGLNVEVAPATNLQRYDQDRKPVFDQDGQPVKVPGKVDAYRFLSFYLGEDSEHFDTFFHKVVDPQWLANGNDPNAAALRQARQADRKPPCWRVLHRVTFVSRVLPDVPPAGAPPLEKAMRQIDVESNYELIRRLDPYVKGAATSLPELAEATRSVLAAQLPDLLPHAADVTGFLAQYYGVDA